jgi:hypothetical protein
MWREALEQNDSDKIRETIHAMAEAAGENAVNGDAELDSNNMDQEMQEQLMKAWAEVASSEIDDWGDILSPPETMPHSATADSQTTSPQTPATYNWRYDAESLEQTGETAEGHFQRGLEYLRNRKFIINSQWFSTPLHELTPRRSYRRESGGYSLVRSRSTSR